MTQRTFFYSSESLSKIITLLEETVIVREINKLRFFFLSPIKLRV